MSHLLILYNKEKWRKGGPLTQMDFGNVPWPDARSQDFSNDSGHIFFYLLRPYQHHHHHQTYAVNLANYAQQILLSPRLVQSQTNSAIKEIKKSSEILCRVPPTSL